MSERDVWDGRPVSFRKLTIEEGEPFIDMLAAGDQRAGRYGLLVATMQWSDTQERVFASVAEVRGQPLRQWLALQRLANKAMFENGLRDVDPDAPPPPANGHDVGVASPSPEAGAGFPAPAGHGASQDSR